MRKLSDIWEEYGFQIAVGAMVATVALSIGFVIWRLHVEERPTYDAWVKYTQRQDITLEEWRSLRRANLLKSVAHNQIQQEGK